MDPEKFKNKKSKIAGTTRVDILKTEYLDENYRVKLLPNTPASESGLVKVAELISDIPQMPMFILRWDEGDNTLDVDIYKNRKICRDPEWICEISRYKGHHAIRLDGDKRLFKIDISIPGRKIFKGVLNIGLLIEEHVECKMHLHFEVTTSSRISQARNNEIQRSQ